MLHSLFNYITIMESIGSTVDFVRSNEGCILHPYLDTSDTPTIGWGNTRYMDGTYVQMTDPPISQAQADMLNMWEVRVIGFAVNAATTGLNLTQNQFDTT